MEIKYLYSTKFFSIFSILQGIRSVFIIKMSITISLAVKIMVIVKGAQIMPRKGENIYEKKRWSLGGTFPQIQRRKWQNQIWLCLCQKLHRGKNQT